MTPATAPEKGGTLAIALTAAAAVAAIGAFATLFSVWASSTLPGPEERLRIATDEYAAGRPMIAAKLAEGVPLSGEEPLEMLQLRSFLIGAGKARAAESREDDGGQRLAMLEATEMLEESAELGFPQGREREGYRLLGQSALRAGRYGLAATTLQKAVDITPSLQRELLPQLAVAQLQAREVPAAQALASIDRLLAAGNLAPGQRRDAERLRGQTLRQMGRWVAAREAFRQVGEAAESAEARAQARLSVAATQVSEAIALRREWAAAAEVPAVVAAIIEEAMPSLMELERTANLPTATEARLWAARAYRCLDQPGPALDRLTMLRLARPFGGEAIAAGLEEFEILAEQQRVTEAAQTIRYLVRETGDPRTFDGRLVSLEQFRERVAAAVEGFRTAGNFEGAVAIARSLSPLIPPPQALLLEAATFRAWGETIWQAQRGQAASLDAALDDALPAAARHHFQAAGDAYAAAARLRFVSEQYTAILWSAIDAYQQGGDFARSLELLEDYLKYEARPRLPRGLIAQGRARLALGKPAAAIPPLLECVASYPRDSLRYEARLIAASAHAELGELQEAKGLLDANLYDGQLTPESPVWRDSLKLLGDLLYREGYETYTNLTRAGLDPEVLPDEPARIEALQTNQEVLERAIQRLEEFATREERLVEEGLFSEKYLQEDALGRARRARYLAAQAHRLAASWPAVEARLPDVLDPTRRLLKRKRSEHLEAAVAGFAGIRKTLRRDEEDRTLSPAEQAMLRNSYISEADTLQESQHWEEAAEAYRGVSLRYMNTPLALEAMLGQARCVQQAGRDREAELIIRQAQKVLKRIPDSWEDRFLKTTRYSRPQWEELLGWMADSGTLVNN